MTINKKQKLIIISAVLLICLFGVACFSYGRHQKQIPAEAIPEKQTMSDYALPADNFLAKIWKICPAYEPSAVGYRTCIDNLLDQKQKEANLALNALVSNVQGQIAADKVTYPGTGVWMGEQTFLGDLATLNKTWKPYQDALCEIEAASYYGGNGQGDAIEECQIRETELFVDQLAKYKEEWVKN